MIVRKQTVCPGCGKMITVRVSVFPTELLRYYVLCPLCKIPIRGSMEGQELESFNLKIESGFQVLDDDSHLPVVTVDPSIPMNTSATGLQDVGGGPNILIFQLAGSEERAVRLMEHSQLVFGMHEQIPVVRRALEYYEQGAEDAFWAYLKKVDLLESNSPHAFTSIHEAAHKLWGTWLLKYAQATAEIGAMRHAAEAYRRWHTKALKNDRYRELLTDARQDGEAKKLTRGLIAATRSMMGTSSAWRTGYLVHGIPDSKERLRKLVLLQDEFDGLRDSYQRVFEACCSSLWPLLYAYNTVKHGDPENFSSLRYQKKGETRWYTVNSRRAFEKLPNSFKLEVISQIPGMSTAFGYLNSGTRNAIGHATAHHDLQSGMIVSDEDQSKTYLEFVGEVYSLTGPLSLCALMSEHVAVAPA